jgi:hypothetical protein
MLLIRYFLSYALLGWLYTKVNATKPEHRVPSLGQAQSYFNKYLRLTRNYELHNYNTTGNVQENSQSTPDSGDSNAKRQAAFDAGLINKAHERNEKIKRYKEQKELESQLDSKLKIVLDSNTGTQMDDEHKRQFYINCIKYWINKSIEDSKIVEGIKFFMINFDSRCEVYY